MGKADEIISLEKTVRRLGAVIFIGLDGELWAWRSQVFDRHPTLLADVQKNAVALKAWLNILASDVPSPRKHSDGSAVESP